MSHLADLTRLMSVLSHHVAMPDVLLSCPEMLPHLLDFMNQVRLRARVTGTPTLPLTSQP